LILVREKMLTPNFEVSIFCFSNLPAKKEVYFFIFKAFSMARQIPID